MGDPKPGGTDLRGTPTAKTQYTPLPPWCVQVLLFTDKNVSTVLYKGLSWAYAKRLAFAEVHATGGAALVEKYGVEKLPTLLVVKASCSS